MIVEFQQNIGWKQNWIFAVKVQEESEKFPDRLANSHMTPHKTCHHLNSISFLEKFLFYILFEIFLHYVSPFLPITSDFVF